MFDNSPLFVFAKIHNILDITTKNIIITFAENYTLNDGENKGRQDVLVVGNLEGYYITNGKAMKITCEKEDRVGKTTYRDLDGNEIEVNDGNTFIHICPTSSNVKIEPGVQENIETKNAG